MVMKTFCILLIMLALTACDRPVGDVLKMFFFIVEKTTTPRTTTIAQGISSNITVSGSDLCYRFHHFDISQRFLFGYEIHARGTYPSKATACPLAIYSKDTVLQLYPSSAGQYLLKFYQEDVLIKTDTVQVN
jgi:hypothetical protein